MVTVAPATTSNALARVAGRDAPAGNILADAITLRHAPVMARSRSDNGAQALTEDYALIDPALVVAHGQDGTEPGDVRPGMGYAGMTPHQRGAFLAWLQEPNRPAQAAFQELYLAQLEVRLFEGGVPAEDAHLALRGMQMEPAWRAVAGVERAILVGYWLQQDGAGLRDWLTQSPVSPRPLALGLGMQALLGVPLTEPELAKIGELWNLPALAAQKSVLKMRLASLITNLQADPLAYVLNSSGQEATEPRPWRSVHRDLRFSLPQPDLRPQLERLFNDVAAIQPAEMSMSGTAFEAAAAVAEPIDVDFAGFGADETIILEFGESRSEYFDYVLQLSQRLEGFSQIMDEDRRLVYRIRFHKGKLRKFWRIWEYVQKWSSTRIYVDGEEIESWKVWPYSQYLR